MIFGKKSVYLGYSLDTFQKIRNAFDEKGLTYEYKVSSPSFETPGRGSMSRSTTGSSEFEQIYEIFVKKANIEEANYYIQTALRQK